MKKVIKWLGLKVAINQIGGSHIIPSKARNALYNALGMNIRAKEIRPQCIFMGNNVSIGENSFLNYRCFVGDNVKIGDNTLMGFEVMLCTPTHEIGNEHKRAGEWKQEPILIGDGCWIGTRATILPGVTVGDGCIIAAGSLVTKDCEPNGLYMGTPAKRIKDLPTDNEMKVSV